jgi:hypothetical protein
MTEPYDQLQRMTAHRLRRDNSGWFVLWGCHSRMFWAFPLIDVAAGTLLADPDPAELAKQMREAEQAAAAHPRPRFTGSSSPVRQPPSRSPQAPVDPAATEEPEQD